MATIPKIDKLKDVISKMGRVLIAYSGGVDSTLLVKVAYEVLGENVLAVTAKSPLYPSSEIEKARDTAKNIGVKHLIIDSDELKISGFAKNPINRCYLCKKELFGRLHHIARKYGILYILDGSNASDTDDFRPGRQAAKEFGVRSLLEEIGITKEEVRQISKKMKLSTYNKPAAACLSSRFPYGKRITYEALRIVETAEEYIKSLGISQVRVRHYEIFCRIEVLKKEIPLLLKKQNELVNRLKNLGYTYVTLDLEGYRTGSMNETFMLCPGTNK